MDRHRYYNVSPIGGVPLGTNNSLLGTIREEMPGRLAGNVLDGVDQCYIAYIDTFFHEIGSGLAFQSASNSSLCLNTLLYIA